MTSVFNFLKQSLRASAFAAIAFPAAFSWAQTTMPMSPASAGGRMQMPAEVVKDMPATMSKGTPMDMTKNMPTDMRGAMMKGMDSMQKMPMSGDVDKDFAMMMKMHHQQALDMAQMELAQGKSTEMKAMARKIITAQKKEIAQFDAWLAKVK